jgi:hypothetical protein
MLSERAGMIHSEEESSTSNWRSDPLEGRGVDDFLKPQAAKDARQNLPRAGSPASGGEALAPLLAQAAQLLAEALLPRLAAELAHQQPNPPPQTDTRRLLTLDELVELLPAGKKPATWKAWLYQRTRLGQIPGCHKLGNRLFFDRELTLPWLTGSPPTGRTGATLDVPADQSHDAQPMDTHPLEPRQGG